MSLMSRHLYKSFGRKPVVTDVSISVKRGEIVGLFGPNGAGKTTSLKEFGLEHIRSSQAEVLSGGERRRVEIARALVGNPHFLLLDEPLAGIDPKSIKDLSALIIYLAQQGMGILVTDHNVKDMLPIVDRAYILHHGKIFQEGPPSEIANNLHVREVYLGESFTL